MRTMKSSNSHLICKKGVRNVLVLGIDPGTSQSAFVVLESEDYSIMDAGLMDNDVVADMLDTGYFDVLAIEGFQSFGMPVGKEVFETAYYIGAMLEKASNKGMATELIFRTDVKMHHCHTTRAKDANIRQVMLDRYGKSGTKNNKGATYGFKADMWSALAIATYWIDKEKRDERDIV